MSSLQTLVEAHQGQPSDELIVALDDLARTLIQKFMNLDQETEEEAAYECVSVSLEKLEKFNGKAKAHAYFSTIMMCVLRQQYRVRK
jgi:hypothetical protein